MRNLQEVPNLIIRTEFEHQEDATASQRQPPFRKGIVVKEESEWDATPWTDRRPASVTRDCSFSKVPNNSDVSRKRKWVQQEKTTVGVGPANAPVRRRLNRGSAAVKESTPARIRVPVENSDVSNWAGDWESPVPTTDKLKSDQESVKHHDRSRERRESTCTNAKKWEEDSPGNRPYRSPLRKNLDTDEHYDRSREKRESTRTNAKKWEEDSPGNRPYRSTSRKKLNADGIHYRSDGKDGRDEKFHSLRIHGSTEHWNGRPHHRESSIQSERTYANRFGDQMCHWSREKDYRKGSFHGFHAGRHQDRFQGGKPSASGERYRKETSHCRYNKTEIAHADRRPKCFVNPSWKLPLRVNHKTGEPCGDQMTETVMKKIRFVLDRHVPISDSTWRKLPKELKRKVHTEVQGFFEEGHNLKPAWITSEAAKIYRREVRNVERNLLRREWGAGPVMFKRTKHC